MARTKSSETIEREMQEEIEDLCYDLALFQEMYKNMVFDNVSSKALACVEDIIKELKSEIQWKRDHFHTHKSQSG